MKYKKGVSFCLTCSRAGGHWLTNRGRRMTKAEMMRLQGMRPATFKLAVSERQLGKQIGNAMSVNVLERIFARALPAARLVANDVFDRWATWKPPAPAAAPKKPRQRAAAAPKKRALPGPAPEGVRKRLRTKVSQP